MPSNSEVQTYRDMIRDWIQGNLELDTKNLEERLSSKYIVNEETGCWEYTGACIPQGYGMLNVKYTQQYVHRLSYRLYVGYIHPSKEIHHKCETKHCFNPDHLEQVYPYQNRQNSKGRTKRDHFSI